MLIVESVGDKITIKSGAIILKLNLAMVNIA